MSSSAGRVLLMPKGDYDSSVTYNMLDMIKYNGITYVCKKTTTGNAPNPSGDNEWWQIMVQRSSVVGVKGDAEGSYRDGNVNLTPANLGLLPVTGSTASIGGLVPPASAADGSKYLKGTGGWENLPDTKLYKVVISGVSSLSSCRFPASGTNANITEDMEVTECYLSNPAAQTGEWSVNFYNGYLTITGSISGTTNITLKFQRAITLS